MTRKKRERTILPRVNAQSDPDYYWTTVLACEHRPDRAYDEEDAGTVVHPNGSLVASFDRGFLSSAAACVLAILWEQQAA